MAEEYLPGTIGERIRDLRKEAKLNLDEFADILGIICIFAARNRNKKAKTNE